MKKQENKRSKTNTQQIWLCSSETGSVLPPTIRSSPANGQVTVRKGGSVTLECKASGNPVPTITWTRKGKILNRGGEKAVRPTILTKTYLKGDDNCRGGRRKKNVGMNEWNV
ncbi:hypothetical protein J437_LFUL004999 [Ladona fulva]|uniref:Ig-like domain-containing protein n=1 Tax=Ladona fulva TaxID=123851 RepID=A0A8K0P0H6_LADFU|nr:hypothetical protein J437_LFUL004999 [Ladona fulva]